MKSTKYQVLKSDFDFATKQLKQYKEIIDQQKQELEAYKSVLIKIVKVRTHPAMYKCWAEEALRIQAADKTLN